MEWLQYIITIGSLIGAILAWVAKLRWSKEFEKAKNETIKAKDAQIATLEREVKSLQDMSPMKIREYFHSVKEQLEEYNEELKKQLEQAKEEYAELEKNIHEKIEESGSSLSEGLKEEMFAVEMESSKIAKLNSLETIRKTAKIISEISNFI